MLEKKRFSQREICRSSDVSLGHVHNVVSWLETNKFVERENRGYTLVNPTGLLRAISLFRSMGELKNFSLSIDVSKEKIMEYLVDKNVIFCLGTATEEFSSFFRAGEISFYSKDSGIIKKELSPQREGLIKLTCYKPDLGVEQDVKNIENKVYSSEIRTVIDMFCDDKAYYTKELLKNIWGIEV